MSTRRASHAGSWYSASRSELSSQLAEWFAQVPERAPSIRAAGNDSGAAALPVKGARVIIGPSVLAALSTETLR